MAIILNTFPQQPYILTAPTRPATVCAIMPDGRRIPILITDYRSQQGFIAISEQVEIDRDDATIAEVDRRVVHTNRETATGKDDSNYIVYSPDGHIVSVSFPTATQAANLLSHEDFCPEVDDQWFHIDLPHVANASHLLCQPSSKQAVSRPHLVLNLPSATDITNMCTSAHCRTVTAHMPRVEVAGSCVFSQCNRGGVQIINVGEMTRLTDASFMFSCSVNLHSVLGSFPALEAMDYMFSFSNRLDIAELTDLIDFSRITTATAAFAACRCTGNIRISAPALVNAGSMFSRIVNDEPTIAVDLDFPVVEDCPRLLMAALPVTSLKLNAPKATDITAICAACGHLTSVEGDFSSVTDADAAFRNCSRLTTVKAVFPSLANGRGMFLNCNLDAKTINSILASLPPHLDYKSNPGSRAISPPGWDDNPLPPGGELPPIPGDIGGSGPGYELNAHIITFTGCPGAAACDPTIALAKGWTVEI